MSQKPAYTEFHPRWYRPRMSTYWWLQRGSYLLFILRELSSVFVAWSIVFLLMLIGAVRKGPENFEAFLMWAHHPVLIVLNVITLIFLFYHMATWFSLAPQAMVARFRGKRVPPNWIILSQYAAWAVVTLVLFWILL